MTIFKFEAIPIEELRLLFQASEPLLIHKWGTFVFSDQIHLIKEDLVNEYDMEFIEQKVIEPLQ